MRLELTRPCEHHPLKMACLPIPPPRQKIDLLVQISPKNLKAQKKRLNGTYFTAPLIGDSTPDKPSTNPEKPSTTA